MVSWIILNWQWLDCLSCKLLTNLAVTYTVLDILGVASFKNYIKQYTVLVSPILDAIIVPLSEQPQFGVVLDSLLLLDAWFAVAAESTRYQFGLVCQLSFGLERKDVAMVIGACVAFKLHYCHGLCVGLPLKTAQKLQIFQNVVAKLLPGSNRVGEKERERIACCFQLSI